MRGATLYKNKINRAKTEEEKKVYIDSLMLIYDMRMEYFGSHSSKGAPYIARAKAMDYAAVNPQDRDGIRKFYREAVAINGAALPTDVAVKYFNELVTDYGSDLIEAEVILNEYENLAPLFEAPGAEGDKETFDALFASSGAANCDNLEALFGPEAECRPQECRFGFQGIRADEQGRMFERSVSLGCGKKYYEQNPSSNVAINLASQFEARNDFSKALQYLNEALATETDPIEKIGSLCSCSRFRTRCQARFRIGCCRPSGHYAESGQRLRILLPRIGIRRRNFCMSGIRSPDGLLVGLRLSDGCPPSYERSGPDRQH
ncbi:MAG: hypothetical protein L6V35_08080 [Alistipes putredinis]|nr:MAG: hypothetical protein L6V35_08080 [Alistipes putredinis]